MNQSERINTHQEFQGDILSARAVEDCIRATGRYTKGTLSSPAVGYPIQGASFPSNVVTEFYRVYPGQGIYKWGEGKTPKLIDWVLSDVTYITVRFKYNYKTDQAIIIIEDGLSGIAKLCKDIPRLAELLKPFIEIDRKGASTWARTQETGKQPKSCSEITVSAKNQSVPV